jgi:hypothetical protein
LAYQVKALLSRVSFLCGDLPVFARFTTPDWGFFSLWNAGENDRRDPSDH